MGFSYFNPNPEGKQVGDCTVRAISKATVSGARTSGNRDLPGTLCRTHAQTAIRSRNSQETIRAACMYSLYRAT